jgi:hypothetical protein
MAESVSVLFTEAELREIEQDLGNLLDGDRSFQSAAPLRDEARVLAYLRIAHARVKTGASRGPDLNLPPWASVVILEKLFPKATKPAKATIKAKPAKKAHAPRKKRPSELRKEAARREADTPLPGLAADDDEFPGREGDL